MKLKEGRKVTCEICGTKIKDARLHYEDGEWFICQNKEDGSNCDNKLGYKYSWSIGDGSGGSVFANVTNLRPVKRTIEDIYVGAKIGKVNRIKEILGICGRVVFVSLDKDFDITSNCFYTIEELKDKGWKLLPEEPEEPQEPEEDMITLPDGRKFSASTIQEALRKYVNEEER